MKHILAYFGYFLLCAIKVLGMIVVAVSIVLAMLFIVTGILLMLIN